MGIKKNKNENQGFTLIEIIVTVGVVSLTLPILFAIVFSILREQTKIIRLKEVKKQGDFVLNTVENTIRNYGLSIHNDIPDESNEICATGGSSGNASYFKDKFDHWFRYYLDTGNNQISSQSSEVAGLMPLTSSKVEISDFSLTCSKTADYSPTVVSISFKVDYNTSSLRPEETASLNYKTKVKLRNY